MIQLLSSLTLAVIHWAYIALIILASAVVVASPFLVVLFRAARVIAHASSDDPRLSEPNMWTEAHYTKDGATLQIMRLKDGNFVLISVGATSVKVFVTPDRSDVARYRVVKDLPLLNATERIRWSPQRRHAEDLSILERVRRAISWPVSADELASALQATDDTLLLDAH
jgi:hypothetical protein